MKGNEPRNPTLLTQAANLVTAVVIHAADGFRRTPEEIAAERKVICEACPHLLPEADKCAICGCHLSVKRAMASEACPDGRWAKA